MSKETNRAHRYARARVKPFYPPDPESLASDWVVTIHSATQEPERWLEHKHAADHSYQKRNIQAVGKDRGIDVERYPTYFAEARIASETAKDKLIGGIRIHLPDQNGTLPLYEEIANYTDVSSLIRSFGAHEQAAYGAGLWTIKGK